MLPLVEKAENLKCEVCIDSPSCLSKKLSLGDLDIAMIPSVEYLKNADSYSILSCAAISSCYKVDTVLFITSKDLKDVQTISLDKRSKTSVALFHILFGNRLNPNIVISFDDPDPENALEKYDAFLVIGDSAFKAGLNYSKMEIYDLSHEWFLLTGRYFVHAVIASRKEIELPSNFSAIFEKIKEEGKKRIPDIAKLYAPIIGINECVAEDYLSNKIIYDLDEKALDGLKTFHSFCIEKGLIKKQFPIQLLQ